MLESPEIRQPLKNDAERQAGIVGLFDLDGRIQQLLDASKQLATIGSMPADIRSRMEGHQAPQGETPEARLQRWTNLFQDDADNVHDVRSRIIHGILVPDADLKGAVWLGRHILDLLLGNRRVA
jgi:hypothetical protein